MRTLWILNLDAEVELARSGSYQTPEPLRAQVKVHAERFARQLPVEARFHVPGDPIVPEPGVRGVCWSPTESARRALRRFQAVVPAVPDVAVLRTINDRRFCAGLGQTIPGARFLDDESELVGFLGRPSPTGAWLCKRAFGFSGRGQRRIDRDRLSTDDQRWLRDALRQGGLQVEPWVEIEAEFCLHGLVSRERRHEFGRPTRQWVDADRAWMESELATPGDLLSGERSALEGETERVAEALHRVGYSGPFGIDAYTYLDRGDRRFNCRSEINARLSMGYPIGMGEGWFVPLFRD